MIGRIFNIARITLTEAIRQKVLNILLLFGVAMIAASSFLSQVALNEQVRFVKDFGCGAIEWIGIGMAVLSVAQLLPQELHNRTIYTILAKPVRRVEFLLGKFLGVVLLLSLSVFLMTLAFAVVLWWQERVGIIYLLTQYPGTEHDPAMMSAYQQELAKLIASVRDPQMIAAILLIFTKIIMTAAIAMVISTFATSFIFTVITTSMIYIVGHLESTAREAWLGRGVEVSWLQKDFLELVALIIPDMNAFTIVDEILDGHVIPWSHTLSLVGYAGAYTIVLLILSELIFEFREI